MLSGKSLHFGCKRFWCTVHWSISVPMGRHSELIGNALIYSHRAGHRYTPYILGYRPDCLYRWVTRWGNYYYVLQTQPYIGRNCLRYWTPCCERKLSKLRWLRTHLLVRIPCILRRIGKCFWTRSSVWLIHCLLYLAGRGGRCFAGFERWCRRFRTLR
jgi:hypothetical protein